MRYPILLAIAVAALVLIPGCSAYSSSVSSDGSITNDYFTVELSSQTDILNGSISYKVIEGDKVIQPDIYTLISAATLLITGDGSYSVSYEAHLYDNGSEISGLTTYLFIGSDSVIDDDTVLYPNTSYDVQFNVSFPEMQFTGPITCSLSIYVYTYNSSEFSMSGGCAVIEIQDDPVAELVDITPGGDVEGSYNKTSGTEGGCPQVIITNSTNTEGGVADSNGDINIVLDIPPNTPFCIKIWNRESYDVRANITIDNIIIDDKAKSHTYNNQKLGAGFARYFCHYNAYSSEYWSTTNLTNVKNNEGWFYSSNGSVTISIDGHYDDGEGNKAQNVRLSVIFRDTPNE